MAIFARSIPVGQKVITRSNFGSLIQHKHCSSPPRESGIGSSKTLHWQNDILAKKKLSHFFLLKLKNNCLIDRLVYSSQCQTTNKKLFFCRVSPPDDNDS